MCACKQAENAFTSLHLDLSWSFLGPASNITVRSSAGLPYLAEWSIICRMAMAFSLAACASPGIVINDPGCTRKTFPKYFDVLRSVSQ